ncbi:hypothetical protein V2G26_014189 [Clonostachys chloroleuca]
MMSLVSFNFGFHLGETIARIPLLDPNAVRVDLQLPAHPVSFDLTMIPVQREKYYQSPSSSDGFISSTTRSLTGSTPIRQHQLSCHAVCGFGCSSPCSKPQHPQHLSLSIPPSSRLISPLVRHLSSSVFCIHTPSEISRWGVQIASYRFFDLH